MFGVYGKYLDINLKKLTIDEYPIKKQWYEQYLGGRGIAARILIEELPKKVHPSSEDNIIVFGTGPLQGTSLAGASRFVVMAKSPKTYTLNDSYAGGDFGHHLGRSGYDGIIIRGKAEAPVYLLVKEGKVEILPADKIWGKDCLETENILTELHGKVTVASIGLAGENQVMMSSIMADHNRAVGRPGYGMLMGIKNLKAIAIWGHTNKKVADPDKLKKLIVEFGKRVMDHDWAKNLREFGTGGGVSSLSEAGMLPTKNFTGGQFVNHADICGRRTNENGILVGNDTCVGCPIRCKREVKTLFNGQAVLPEWGGPEYETYGALGSFCLNNDLESICLLNQKCNKYGVDTISFGVIAAYLMEATERGLLKDSDAISWGDSVAMDQLLEKIVHRKGIGEWAARGLDYLSLMVGDSTFAVHCKGQEVPAHDPRARKSIALYYSVSPRGANHMEGTLDGPAPNEDIGVGHNDINSWDDRAFIAGSYLMLRSFGNSLIICSFVTDLNGPGNEFPLIREILKAVTGREFSVKEMMEIGERNFGLLRLHAEQEGFTRSDDDLPKRLKTPLTDSGKGIVQTDLDKAIDEFYELYDYNPYGPSDERLRKLGMGDLLRRKAQ